MSDLPNDVARDFIRDMVRGDLAEGKHGQPVTRFPPEPNGYLHIGHAKSICLNFGIANEFGGRCHLRYDDTNPSTEDPEFVEEIQRDVHWLGFDWGEHLYFASDYFERFYKVALGLVRAGLAYVDSLSEEEIREYRGTVKEAGRESPYRSRSAEENVELLKRMRAGEFADGEHVLRAKIDMAAANMKMRDPLLYRIRHEEHYRSGGEWPIYPLYDFAHPLSDAFEGITHSLCTLEFENNREIYDWLIEKALEIGEIDERPEQTEFARLNMSYTILSKRKLAQLVDEGRVEGWDDPRMPTLSGLRRRGYTPGAIRAFCDAIGVAKANATIDVALLEHSVRDDLNHEAPRVLAVLDPLEVVITNYPEGKIEELEAPYYPHDVPKEGSRRLPFARRLLIDRDDFREDPPKKYHRLAPGRAVRLRHAYVIRCDEVIKNEAGEVERLHCTYFPESLGSAKSPDVPKAKGTIHWLSAEHALEAEVRLYDRLFAVERPDAGKGGPDFRQHLNPDSLEILEAWVEPGLAGAEPGSRFQFERQGYFYLEPESSRGGERVFNRIVPLRDTWAKIAEPAQKPKVEKKKVEGQPQPESEPEPLEGEAKKRYERYLSGHGLSEHEARLLAQDTDLAELFEATIAGHGNARAVANWVVHELPRELKESTVAELPFGAGELAELVELVDGGKISAASGKEVLEEMLASGRAPGAIVEERGLAKVGSAAELEPIVDAILERETQNVELYRGGKTALMGYFIGQVMKETQGRADAQVARAVLAERLG